MRWAALFVFILLIGAVDWVIIQRHDAYPVAPGIAARDLPAGTLLEPGDLQPSPPVGRYARTAVRKGDKVTDLTDAPALAAPTAGDMIVGLPAERALVAGGVINAKGSVIICRGGAPVAPEPVVVEAVVCATGATACTAMIEAPVAMVAAVAATSKDPINLRPAGAAKPCW